MRCYDPRSREVIRTVTKEVDKPETLEALADLNVRCTNTTRFLCYMLGEARINDTFDRLPDEIKEWSKEHDQMDTERIVTKIKELRRSGKDQIDIVNLLNKSAENEHPLSNYHKQQFLYLTLEEFE